MTTATIQIDVSLLHRLVRDGVLSLVEAGSEIIASAGEKLKLSPAKISEADFDLFWKRYPRRVGKRAAKTAFENAVKRGATPDEIQGGLDPAGMKSEASTARYIPHPATWLNRDGWLDERCDTTTVHDQLREALLHDTRIRTPDALVDLETQRLSGPVSSAGSSEHGSVEADEAASHSGSGKRGDPLWDW